MLVIAASSVHERCKKICPNTDVVVLIMILLS